MLEPSFFCGLRVWMNYLWLWLYISSSAHTNWWWYVLFSKSLDEWHVKMLSQMLSLLNKDPHPFLLPPHPRLMVLKMRARHMCWLDGRGTGFSRASLKAQLLHRLLYVQSPHDAPSCSQNMWMVINFLAETHYGRDSMMMMAQAFVQLSNSCHLLCHIVTLGISSSR